jgi:TonB-linked SusC/RagA family outer membrane protein
MKHLYLKTLFRRVKNSRMVSAVITVTLLCLLHLSSLAQGNIVSGIVTDENGSALPGVNVIVKGSTAGTTTDVNGKYSLSTNNSTETVLVFSFIGYMPQEVTVSNRSSLDISLAPDVQALQEVVVVGYGTQRKSDLTGAIASVKATDIVKIGGSNIAEGLQGKTPGVEILNQGGPGAAPVVRVRGLGTNSDPNPLYVVDGMMVSNISFLSPNDIASMEILKDASSTAIYGSRGANGVVLITTKKGKEGKTTVNISGSEGFQFLARKYDAANGEQYARLVNLVKSNMGQAPIYTDEQIASFGNGTDWTKESTQNGLVRDYQIGISGGTDKMIYNISSSYFRQQGVIKYSDYDRLTLRANNTYKLHKRVSLSHNLTFVKSNTAGDVYWNGGRGLNSMSRISPLLSVRDENGNFVAGQDPDIVNPYAAFYLNKDKKTRGLQFVGNAWLDVTIADGLTFRSSYGVDYTYNKSNNFEPAYNISSPNQTHPSASLQRVDLNISTWLWENTLSYDKELGTDHHINLVAGITAQETNTDILDLTGTGMLSEDENLRYIQSFPVTSLSMTGVPSSSSIASYLGRINYTLKDRYLLTASIRADGSSRFPAGSRWGYFPSAALGWRVSDESFMQGITWLSNLKVRASWGQVGNEKIGDYRMYSTLTSGQDNTEFNPVFNNVLYQNATINTAVSNNITWEFSQQTDIGFELGAFNERLTLEADYYTRDTKDLLLTLPIPGGSVGLSPAVSNAGSVRNRGIEIALGWNDNIGDFKYGVRFTGSANRNKVLDFKKLRSVSSEWMTNAEHMTEEGYAIGEFYGYKVAGIFQSQAQIDEYNTRAKELSGNSSKVYWSNLKPGDFIYADLNGDGFVDVNDKTHIGSPHAKFVGGLSLTVGYKGFDLSVDFVGSFGAQVWNVARNQIISSGVSNLHTEWLDSWTPANTNTDMPRLATNANYVGIGSSFNVMDADYIKARNIEAGYTFNKNVLNKIHATSLRLYVNLTNPFYITKYPGFSPEVSNYWSVTDQGNDFRTYPVSGTARIGLNMTF